MSLLMVWKRLGESEMVTTLYHASCFRCKPFIQKISIFLSENPCPVYKRERFERPRSKSRISFLCAGVCSCLMSFEYEVCEGVRSLFIRSSGNTEPKADKRMHSSRRCGVQSSACTYSEGFRSSWVISRFPAPALNPNTPIPSASSVHVFLSPFVCLSCCGGLEMDRGQRRCDSRYAHVWAETGYAFVPGYMQLHFFHALGVARSWICANVGVIFSINSAEIGGNLSQLVDWVSFQVAMWGEK